MRNNFPTQPARPALPGDLEPEYTYAVEPEPAHLRDYWRVLVKRRRLVAIVFFVALALGAYIPFTATTMYTATSTIKIEPQNPQVTAVEMMNRNFDSGGGPYDYYQTQYKLLESRTLAAKVVAELNLESNKSFNSGRIVSDSPSARIKGWTVGNLQYFISVIQSLFESKEIESKEPEEVQTPAANGGALNTETSAQGPNVDPHLVSRYMQFLRVSPVKNTRLVDISAVTPDPRLSQILANAHAGGFIRLVLESRFELTKEARDFLESKNAELKRKLERSEDALNRFRQQHGVVSMDKGENIVVDRLVDLNKQLTLARTQRLEAESLHRTVAGKSSQHLAQVLTQGLIPSLRANLMGLEAEKVKLSSVFKPEHPRMVELNQQITETKRSLTTEIASVIRGIEEAFNAARAREQALENEAQKQQQTALSLKEAGVQYAVLDEEVKVNRTLYESVLKRLNETSVSNDLAVSNIQITQRAERPTFPSSPNLPANVLLFSVLGLVLGVGVAYFLEYLDSKLATPENVWTAVALNTLGVVPDLTSLKSRLLDRSQTILQNTPLNKMLPGRPPSDSSASASKLVVAHHPLSIITESYRTIRTSLLFAQGEKPPQVILLTSPSPGDGKTMTTLNLGITLAQDKYNVLVIDADLRKGCCHSRMGLKNYKGLSSILRGDLSSEKGIQKTPVMGLSLLSRGTCPSNPSELLGSRFMRELLMNLRESYDFILIDSPPVVAVSDASVLSVLADGVVLVLNSRTSTTEAARHAMTRLEAVRAPVLGVILNSIDLDNPDYAYYRTYYGSGYANFEDEGNGHHNPDTKQAAHAELRQIRSWSPDDRPGAVSREFFDRMIAKLSEFAGPMAALIVHDTVAMLGESPERFPNYRLNELLDRVRQEIPGEGMRVRFEDWLAGETEFTSRATRN